VLECAVGVVGQVLMKGATARDVQSLRPAAYPEDGKRATIRRVRDGELEAIEVGLGGP
jgi:hypothetical protein